MFQSMNTEQMLDTVNDMAHQKRDYIMPVKELDIGKRLATFAGHTYEATPHFHGQVADWTGIGRTYYRKMLAVSAEGADALLKHNWEFWRDLAPDSLRMVRTLENGRDISRAFLSNKFLAFDNEHLLDAAGPVLRDSGAKVLTSHVDTNGICIKATWPKQEITVNSKVGDIVQLGVMLTNSEVGEGSIKIEPLLYRLACTNGMTNIMPEGRQFGFRRPHLGTAQQAGGIEWKADTMSAHIEATRLAFRDAIEHLGKLETLQLIQETLTKAAEAAEVKSPVDGVKLIEQHAGLTETEGKVVLENFIRDADVNGRSRWGMANAITLAAEKAETFDRATELEAAGGKIMRMRESVWAEIAEAA